MEITIIIIIIGYSVLFQVDRSPLLTLLLPTASFTSST
jgi:hypothetical protein